MSDRRFIRETSWSVAVAVLTVLWWAAVARAADPDGVPDDTRSMEPQHLLGVRGPHEQPFQLALHRDHLLGDWLGLRTWLEGHGITPTLTYDTEPLGNPIGGIDHGFTAVHNLGLSLVFDLEKLHDPKGGFFKISANERWGKSLTVEHIGNDFTVQQMFGRQTYGLINLDYRQKLLAELLEVRLGRMPIGDDFLVSPYACAFVQNSICGNPVSIFFNAPPA